MISTENLMCMTVCIWLFATLIVDCVCDCAYLAISYNLIGFRNAIANWHLNQIHVRKYINH